MKKVLTILLVLTQTLAWSQDNYCGTEMSEDQMTWLRNWQLENLSIAGSTREDDIIYVPLKVHVVGNDEGGGYISLNILMQDICDLNDQFAPTGFYFYIYEGINYINNSDYYNHDWLNGAYMMSENNVANVVNMYFVGDHAGNCGYFSPSGNAMAVANACAGIGNSTIAHELGHFFSLPHTFYGWEWGTPSLSEQEQVDGDNCVFAADGFCDTPPDYAPYRWNCSGPPTFTDPDGVEFQPDGTYYMSYSNDECTDKFSPLQQEAMIANINGPRDELLAYDPIVITDVDTTTLLFPEDLQENLFSNYAELSWASVENAEAYIVLVSLTVNFTAIAASIYTTDTSAIITNLLPEKTYRWKVKVVGEGNTCEGYNTYRTFSTGAETFSPTSIEDIDGTAAMQLYPNPVALGGMVNVTVDGQMDGQWQVRMMDITGRQVMNSTETMAQGRLQLEMPATQAGMYIIQLSNGDKFFQSAIQVN